MYRPFFQTSVNYGRFWQKEIENIQQGIMSFTDVDRPGDSIPQEKENSLERSMSDYYIKHIIYAHMTISLLT